ncbi:putative RNA-directed DNA polymerase [Tanacetum coccineum]
MVREVSFQEVKDALFSMGDDKSPGPDGFTAAFFKETWSVTGNDVYNAVCEFFRNGTLLKEVNHTIIALLPKVKSPSRINDYRPISCCNVLFKCLSKIIANRIKQCLKHIVSPNQSAFVPGRSITDNILLTQELMHNYHLDRGSPRCAFKVDIQKAYDTVDWNFLRMILHGFGFHDKMVSWIMECVTSTSYSININGSIHGFFKGKRGLRQGDPLSPYLFTLVMEVLTLMLQRKIHESDQFTYHRYCSKLELVNLCFADDLFLFAYGDVHSVSIIKEALDEFKVASGLVPSLPKSTAFFCNVLNHVKLSILQVLPFEEGTLPVKYLGVPLVSSRLKIRDCNELVDRVQLRISDWKNKSLSIAGRLQLIQSVLGSMHIYWASVFMLPSNVLLNIEQLMRQFLWSHGKSGKSKSKVAWEVVCLPKDEGGLGIRRLECFNYALMSSHIWKLLTLKESLWVKWIHEYKIKGRNFWDIPLRGNMSWGWRKILNLRPKVRNFIWKVIGNGASTSLWYDKWTDLDPLATRISPRDIHNAGLSFQSKVSDIVVQGSWVWPHNLSSKYSFLNDYVTPVHDEVLDRMVWRNRQGRIENFSVSQVWSDIRHRNNKVAACPQTRIYHPIPPKRRSQTNPQPPLTQETVDQLVQDGIEAAIRAERERVKEEETRAGGPAGGPVARECTFTGFMKCGPKQFYGIEGAVATLGLEVANGKPWTEVKMMMIVDFCPIEEDQTAYTERFNELAQLCPDAVPNEKNKVAL